MNFFLIVFQAIIVILIIYLSINKLLEKNIPLEKLCFNFTENITACE